jgi:hypothetical protein
MQKAEPITVPPKELPKDTKPPIGTPKGQAAPFGAPGVTPTAERKAEPEGQNPF